MLADTVWDGNKNPKCLADFLDEHKDNLGIGKVIIKEVIEIVVGNECLGGQIMAILLEQFKDEVCKSISAGVVAAAAGNEAYGAQIIAILLNRSRDEVCKSVTLPVVMVAANNQRYGAPIMEMLLQHCKDGVCRNISIPTIWFAAQNAQSGALILKSLLEAIERKVSRVISQIFSKANSGNDWLAKLVPELKRRLEEIPYKIIYPVASSMQAEQYSSIAGAGSRFSSGVLADGERSNNCFHF